MWVIVILAVLVALAVFLLCVPFSIALRLDVYGSPKFHVRLGWLFGLVDRDIKKREKKPKEPKSKTESKPKPRGKRVSPKLILELLRTRGLLRRIWQLIADLLRLLKIRDFKADFTVGLDDPADTGLLFAAIGLPLLFLSPVFTDRISVRPSFSNSAALEGYIHALVKLRPIQLIMPVIGFVFSLPALRVIKILTLSKWKRKK